MSKSNKYISIIFILHMISSNLYGQSDNKTEIALLGVYHFNQVHDSNNTSRDYFSKEKQEEIDKVLKKLIQFNPDRIYIEREEKDNLKVDSLFSLYKQNKIELKDIKSGAGEVYQLGFKLAKKLNHKTLYGIDYYESVSQGLLKDGENFTYHQQSLQNFQNLGRAVVGNLLLNKSDILSALKEMNSAKNLEMSYKMLFNTPAYVKNGSFKNYKNIKKSEIDSTYIGAEYISLFYERNIKIYSNIINQQINDKGEKILVIIGQVHAGVIIEMLEHNTNYNVQPIIDVLNFKD